VTELRGPRVLLRPFRPDEFDTVIAVRAREAAPAAVWEGASEDGMRRRLALSGTRTTYELLFAMEAGERLIGEIQARHFEGGMPPGVFELGVEIFEAADRGKGFGPEAVVLITSHLFGREGAHRVQVSTDMENAAMRRVLEGLGFPFEGVLREFMPTPEGLRDYAMYAMTKHDWETVGYGWTLRS